MNQLGIEEINKDVCHLHSYYYNNKQTLYMIYYSLKKIYKKVKII